MVRIENCFLQLPILPMETIVGDLNPSLVGMTQGAKLALLNGFNSLILHIIIIEVTWE